MPKKESFSEIQQVSRKDTLKRILGIGIVVAVIVGAAAAIRFINTEPAPEVAPPEAPTPPPVPTSINYYDPSGEETYTTGVDYIIMTRDGNRIRVGADGSVFLVDENGRIIRMLTGSERDMAIEQALEIQGYDSEVNIALSGLEDIVGPEEPVEPVVEPMTTENMIEALAASRGLSMEDFNQMLYLTGTNPAQFMRIASGDGVDLETLVMSTIDSAQALQQEQGEPTLAATVEGVNIQDSGVQQADTSLPDWLQPIDATASMNAMMQALGNASASPNQREMEWEAVNQNQAQRTWLEEQQSREAAQSVVDDHYLVAGTVVPITIVTGINTDLPGDVVGVVRQNVYDTLTGRNILIPKGSRLLASYNNSVAFGQKSVQIAWNQLVTPDGYVFTLPGFQGVDGEGYSGNQDKYNSHFWSILGAAVLGSVINYGAGYLDDQAQLASEVLTGTDIISILSGSAIDTTQDFMDQWVQLWMNRQPTIKIRPGYQTQLLVNQNINLRRTIDR